MNFTGKIIAICPMQTGQKQDGTQWRSMDIVVEELNGGQYPAQGVFNIYGDKIDKFVNLLVMGNVVSLEFDFRARPSQKDPNRWFGTSGVWKMEQATMQAQQPMMQAPQMVYPQAQPMMAQPMQMAAPQMQAPQPMAQPMVQPMQQPVQPVQAQPMTAAQPQQVAQPQQQSMDGFGVPPQPQGGVVPF